MKFSSELTLLEFDIPRIIPRLEKIIRQWVTPLDYKLRGEVTHGIYITHPFPHSTLPLPATALSFLPSLMSSVTLAPQPDMPDVHTLVAFAAFAANQTSADPPEPRFRYWRANIFGKPLILDAIADICVTERRPEPAAVALTIDTKLHQVRLLITQGGVTQPDEQLLSHICKIWGLLQKHSKQALGDRRQSLGQVGLTKPEQCLHRHIYLAKRVEVMRVIGKWWPMLDSADRQLGRSRRALGKKVLQSSPMSPFRQALLSLLSLKSWQQVVSLMDAASGHFRAMIDQCRRRGGSYKGIYRTYPSVFC